jgi:hypothetical protein
MDVTSEYFLELPYKIMWISDFSDWREGRKVVHLTAYVEEVPEVRATADTAEEAVLLLRERFTEWLEKALADGVYIPRPSLLTGGDPLV